MEHGGGRYAARTTRRALLGAAAAIGLGGCGAGTSSAPAPTPTPTASPDRHRFPGDPGDGHVYLGTSLTNDMAAAERPEVGGDAVGMTRRFYQPYQSDLMAQMAASDAAAGILPFVSVKVPGTWSQVARGDQDPWLEGLLELLAAVDSPVLLALHHEPENDVGGVGMAAADWVAMQTRALSRARATAEKVTVVPVLMRWSFDSSSGRDPREWLVPDTVLQGVDVYNPWDGSGRRLWIPFSELVGPVSAAMGDRPLVVPELGSAPDPADPTRQAAWLAEAFDTAVRSHIVGLAWFESSIERREGFYRLDVDGQQQLRALLERPEAARLTERP